MKKKKRKPLCKILTVDDEMGVDSFFYEFFTRRNFEVLSALSGREAIELVKEESPRLVLLDVRMRGMDGLETLKKIKQIDKDVKVIMVSGVDDDETIKRAKKLGADDYVVKPFSLEYLEKVVLLRVLNLQIKDIEKTIK